ncbi:MAG TPA: tripartite tricarboxylate transporter substrate-binding protein, partial [Anaeromyxobacteraceae bacterium]|nr:tripartite tricarboxylate transporter substrate-binding protein [Anaeromyxobacteraceae bacterium]
MPKRLAILAAAVLAAGPARAAWPERPITMIVPFAAGGPTDVIARIAGEHMSRTLGQQIVVENVAGAGGTTGISRAAASTPDGYTIMMGHMGTHGAAPAVYPNLKYDPTKDFAPVSLVAGTPILIVAKKDFPAKDLREFVAKVKDPSAKIKQAHAGVGSVSFTTCTLLT